MSTVPSLTTNIQNACFHRPFCSFCSSQATNQTDFKRLRSPIRHCISWSVLLPPGQESISNLPPLLEDTSQWRTRLYLSWLPPHSGLEYSWYLTIKWVKYFHFWKSEGETGPTTETILHILELTSTGEVNMVVYVIKKKMFCCIRSKYIKVQARDTVISLGRFLLWKQPNPAHSLSARQLLHL